MNRLNTIDINSQKGKVMTLTTNINYLQPTGFKLVMDRKHYGNLQFFASSVNHPSVTVVAPELSYKRANIMLAGDKLRFGEVSFSVILDEDMKSYQEMYDWMQLLVENPNTRPTERTDTIPATTADISLVALTSHNNSSKTIRYIDAVPTSLGDIAFEATSTENHITFPVTFAFSYFELV